MSNKKDLVDVFLNVLVKVRCPNGFIYLIELNSPMEDIFASGNSRSSLVIGKTGVSWKLSSMGGGVILEGGDSDLFKRGRWRGKWILESKWEGSVDVTVQPREGDLNVQISIVGITWLGLNTTLLWTSIHMEQRTLNKIFPLIYLLNLLFQQFKCDPHCIHNMTVNHFQSWFYPTLSLFVWLPIFKIITNP